MSSRKAKKQSEIKALLAQLPYYSCKDLTSAHPQFNSLIDDNRPSRKSLDSFSSLYDLSVFQLNSLDRDIDPDINFTSNRIRSKYYSPHSFAQFIDSKQLQSKISFLHTNIRSLKKNFEEFQQHVLSELNFRFTIIGVRETRICDRECSFNFVPELPGYCFESVPTPLSAGGVSLFIDQNCKYRVLERVSNSCYQTLWIELHLPNNTKSVCGVTYRQHNNANEFLEYLSDFLERQCRQKLNTYLMGDFNIDLLKYETCGYTQTLLQTMQSFSMVPVVDKPTRGLAKTHTKALKVIEQYAAKLDLIDAWRALNQDARRYTWRRRNPEIHCRLDFFLVSQSVMSNVKDTDISAGYKTDHSLITIKIAQHSNTRGPGFWKLNKSFLKETEYINQIRETIEQVKLEYREDKYVNPALMWEMIKLKIRVKPIHYGKSKRSRMLREEEQLESLVNNLQKDIENGKKEDKETTTIQRKLDETTRKLEKIIEYKTKGAILRSKCRWHNEGEKNTKYFLNLEKRHYKSSVITQLKVSDTDFITSDNEILNECETFYRNIYSSKTNSLDSGHLFFDATGLPSLDPEEKEKCEGPLTKTECFHDKH